MSIKVRLLFRICWTFWPQIWEPRWEVDFHLFFRPQGTIWNRINSFKKNMCLVKKTVNIRANVFPLSTFPAFLNEVTRNRKFLPFTCAHAEQHERRRWTVALGCRTVETPARQLVLPTRASNKLKRISWRRAVPGGRGFWPVLVSHWHRCFKLFEGHWCFALSVYQSVEFKNLLTETCTRSSRHIRGFTV